MTLEQWLKENKKTPTELARAIRVTTSAITRLIAAPGKKQRRKPGRALIAKIQAATRGEVTANDFMDDDSLRDPSSGNAASGAVPSERQSNARGVTAAQQKERAA